MTEHTGRREQIALSRDVLGLVGASLTGEHDLAAEMVDLLLSEPERLPFVFGAFVSLVGVALRVAPDTPPGLFVEACRATIDRAEATDRG